MARRSVSIEARSARLRERAKKVASVRTQAAETQPVTLFRRAHQLFGVPIASVRSALKSERLFEVPGASKHVVGALLNDGVLTAVVDLAQLYDLPMVGMADLKGLIVVEANGRRLGVACDCVIGVQQVSQDSIGPAAAPRGALLKSARWREETVQLLDVPALLLDPRLNPAAKGAGA